ncbi:chaperone protein [Renibacterium salmoninarum ATCC 33209]|uniref:Chaperone protein n=1 Tax=Renibacterium salmoninarum (strain ATCC 33209 / DSM 20767 / JCM 11484 / NBRC 15589 / NCIMB 2235) TaxID=288705 RepID=A9WSY2_RENSM|nr:HSP90 family protein [Renibacterium salmoninarum]ABY23920.1 chaperone protein [Renibacterium salmoninarum ATCC 33209]
MTQESTERPFQVDLRGVVDLLSRHIYSTPQVYLRELMQNGVDAISARKLQDPNAEPGRIRIEHNGARLTVSDNGVGLTLDEAAQLLATVGRSSKRDSVLNLRREDFLGQFGIGLLSCFLVTDNIRVRSRSATGSQAIEWVGSAEGTFTLRSLDEDDIPVGTTIVLDPRPDDAALLSRETVQRLALHYGQYLPVSIDVNGQAINRTPPFLNADLLDTAFLGKGTASGSELQELRELGKELLGAQPLDAIRIDIPGTGTRGVAFVLPSAPPPSAHQANRAYLGRMLLSDRVDDLLPDWAFFVRCVVDTTGLQPTASREQLVEDSALEFTREELGKILKRWIVQLATTQPSRFDQFLAVHQLALRSLALYDDELAQVIVPWLSVETASGRVSCRELIEAGGSIRYTETVDEFRQIAAVVPAGTVVVNGGYTYESEFIRGLVRLNPALSVERIRVAEVLDELSAPSLEHREVTAGLEQRAEAALAESHCKVSVRLFAPEQLPALYVADPEVLRRIEREKSAELAPGFWAGIMNKVDAQLNATAGDSGEAPTSRLCLNWATPLMRELATVRDEVVFDRTVRLLYVQAMLEGHRPLTTADRAMLTGSLTDLIHLSVTADFGTTAGPEAL